MRNPLLLVFFISFFTLSAQQQPADQAPEPLQKKDYRYLGIQGNLLVQQFISFNSNSSINTNPYIFSYAKNNVKTGSGIAFGTGFSINQNNSNDGVSEVDVQNINVTFRVGSEKKYLQDQRLIPFWGMDFAAGVVYNRVQSTLNQSFNSATTLTESTKIFAGPDLRGGLYFAITKHVLLGTEFFFNVQIAVSEVNTNGSGTQSVLPFNIGFQAPTALFLTFRY